MRHCSRSILFLFLLLHVARLHAGSDDRLREKIGQMVMLGFSGSAIDDTLRMDLAGRNLGGVVLLGANCISPLQLQGLSASIRAAAQTPPFISIDEEGGKVARLNQRNGYAATATAYMLGSILQSLDSTGAQAAMMAGWVSQAGLTTNFAPVVDVNVNPASPAIGYYGRSFSSRPSTVAEHARQFVDRTRAMHIMTCLKHFPGHGSAGTDSHLTLPDITTTWADSELIPYRELLSAHRVDMVMIGHLYNARVDSVYPASLSYNTITGILRDTLQYQGVVISDDLYNMKAITDNFGLGETVEHAVNAGTDILLFVSDFLNGASLCRQIVDTIEAKVANGSIAAARIDEAYDHIMQLKQSYLTTGTAAPAAAGRAVPERLLLASYPNPFNPSTRIRFGLPQASHVTLRIYNALGQEVRMVADRAMEAGLHEETFDGTGLASGMYLCRITAGRSTSTVKLLLMR